MIMKKSTSELVIVFSWVFQCPGIIHQECKVDAFQLYLLVAQYLTSPSTVLYYPWEKFLLLCCCVFFFKLTCNGSGIAIIIILLLHSSTSIVIPVQARWPNGTYKTASALNRLFSHRTSLYMDPRHALSQIFFVHFCLFPAALRRNLLLFVETRATRLSVHRETIWCRSKSFSVRRKRLTPSQIPSSFFP